MMIIFPYLTGTARQVWLDMDSFFTGRLKYGAFAFYKMGFSLLGQHLIINRKEYWEGFWFDSFACDNGYMWMEVSYGMIYIILFGYLFWKYSKRASFEEKIIVIAYSLYTMMELYVTYMYYCFAVIMISRYIWENKNTNTRMIGRNKDG